MRGSYPCAASVIFITRGSVLEFVIGVIDRGTRPGIVGPHFQLSSSQRSRRVGNSLSKLRVIRKGVISVGLRGTSSETALS